MVKVFSLLALAHVVSSTSGNLFASAADMSTEMTRPDLHSTDPTKSGGSPVNVFPDKDAHEEKMDLSWSERLKELTEPLLRSESIKERTEAKSESFLSFMESWLPRTATSSAQLHDTQPANAYDPEVDAAIGMIIDKEPLSSFLEKNVDPIVLLQAFRRTVPAGDYHAVAKAKFTWEHYIVLHSRQNGDSKIQKALKS